MRVSRTGTITTSTSSTAVTGSGTLFTTQLAAGSIITTTGGAVIGTVASITDNTNLTLTANAASSNTGIAYNAQVVPFSGDAAVIVPGASLTVTENATINSIAFNNTSSSAATLSVNSSVILTVTAGITLRNAAGGNTAATITGSGTINCASVTVGGSPNYNYGTYTMTLTSTISTLSISGNLAVTGQDYYGGYVNNATFALGSGSVSVGGSVAFTTDFSLGYSTATLDMTAGAQTGTLTLSGSTPFTRPAMAL